MKDFNNTTANVGQKIVAIDALVQTSASKAYIIGAAPGQELPVYPIYRDPVHDFGLLQFARA